MKNDTDAITPPTGYKLLNDGDTLGRHDIVFRNGEWEPLEPPDSRSRVRNWRAARDLPVACPTSTTYPKDRKILALDLATTTGFAFLGNGVIHSGAVSFKRSHGRKTIADDHIGESYIQFQKWLRWKIRDFTPDLIVFEEPMGNFKSSHARNVIVGFRGILMVNAAYYSIPVFGYAQSSIKKFATGSGRADKELMEATALMKFPDQKIQDDNQADALFILHYYLDQEEKKLLQNDQGMPRQ